MSTYRTGNHWGVTIVREGVFPEGEHDPDGDELVAVVTNGDQALAERICALLNGDEPYEEPACGCPVVRFKGRSVLHAIRCPERETARFVVNGPPVADWCHCVEAGYPGPHRRSEGCEARP